MPIANPEVYAEMLDRAKAGGLRLSRDQRHLVGDAERRAAGVRRGGERRHPAGVLGRRGVLLRRDGEGHGRRRGRRWRSSPRWSPRTTR